MVDGIAGGGRGRIDAARTAAQQTVGKVSKPVMARPIARVDGGQATTASRVAAEGAPIDAAKVSAIRTAISEGRYPVDAQKIAARMLELDLSPLK